MKAQDLPFYSIRKTRPSRLLGSLFIVIGLSGSDDYRSKVCKAYMMDVVVDGDNDDDDVCNEV